MDVRVVELRKTGVIMNVDGTPFLFSRLFLETTRSIQTSVLVYSLKFVEFGGSSLHFLVCAYN